MKHKNHEIDRLRKDRVNLFLNQRRDSSGKALKVRDFGFESKQQQSIALILYLKRREAHQCSSMSRGVILNLRIPKFDSHQCWLVDQH